MTCVGVYSGLGSRYTGSPPLLCLHHTTTEPPIIIQSLFSGFNDHRAKHRMLAMIVMILYERSSHLSNIEAFNSWFSSSLQDLRRGKEISRLKREKYVDAHTCHIFITFYRQ